MGKDDLRVRQWHMMGHSHVVIKHTRDILKGAEDQARIQRALCAYVLALEDEPTPTNSPMKGQDAASDDTPGMDQ